MFLKWQTESLKLSFLQSSRNLTSTVLKLTWDLADRTPSGLWGQVERTLMDHLRMSGKQDCARKALNRKLEKGNARDFSVVI